MPWLDFKDKKQLVSLGLVIFILLTIPILVITTRTTRDTRTKADTTPNDPCFVSGCPGIANSQQWALNKINAPKAWDITKGSAAVKVAQVDSGIRMQPDLTGQVGTGINEITPGGSTDDDYGSYGLGTWVASIIGAATNNGRDMAGINWNTTILPVKVCSFTTGCPNAAIASGINWAVANGAQVINIAISQTTSTPEIDAAVANAISQGVIVVAAAGDNASQTYYPAADPGVISVGATDQNDVIGSFSGKNPSMVAPGQQVTSLVTGGCCRLNTGTALASAHVSGAAALLLAAGVPAASVKTALFQGAKDLGTAGVDSVYGNGRLDICAAFQKASVLLGRSNLACGGTTGSKPGDITGDGSVNISDLNALINNWGSTNASADLDKSGKVDLGDLSVLINYWGS